MTGQPQNAPQQEQSQADRPAATLVAYYSRTGITRALAEALAERLGGDLEEIVDTKSRKGPLGFIVAGKDAVRKNLTEIEPVRKNPADYDLMVVGTPVWAGTMASAVRTYLTRHGRHMQKVAFFCTQGGSKPGHTFADMEALCGRPPLDTLSLRTKTVKRGDFGGSADDFCDRLKSL